MNGQAWSESYTIVPDKPGIFTQGSRSFTLAQIISGLCDLLVMIYWKDLRLGQDERLRVTFSPETKRWDFRVKAEWAVEVVEAEARK